MLCLCLYGRAQDQLRQERGWQRALKKGGGVSARQVIPAAASTIAQTTQGSGTSHLFSIKYRQKMPQRQYRIKEYWSSPKCSRGGPTRGNSLPNKDLGPGEFRARGIEDPQGLAWTRRRIAGISRRFANVHTG